MDCKTLARNENIDDLIQKIDEIQSVMFPPLHQTNQGTNDVPTDRPDINMKDIVKRSREGQDAEVNLQVNPKAPKIQDDGLQK